MKLHRALVWFGCAGAAVAQAPQDTHIYRVGHGVSAPVVLRKIDPAYPVEARRAGREGTVPLWLVVDANGRAQNVTVTHSLGYDFDENAVRAVRRWRFKPAMKDGHPVSVQALIEVNFHLP